MTSNNSKDLFPTFFAAALPEKLGKDYPREKFPDRITMNEEGELVGVYDEIPLTPLPKSVEKRRRIW